MNTAQRELGESIRLSRITAAALGVAAQVIRPGVLVYTGPDGRLWHAEINVSEGGWADLAEAEKVLT